MSTKISSESYSIPQIKRGSFLRSEGTVSEIGVSAEEKKFGLQSFNPVDKVSISEEAKALLAQEENTLPLNAYSLPNWMKDYVEPFVVTDSIDHAFWNNISKMSNEKHRTLTTFSQDQIDYHEALHNHFKDTLAENGIISSQDYYEKIVLDENNSEKIHQSMLLKIKNDPQILGLMETLGV